MRRLFFAIPLSAVIIGCNSSASYENKYYDTLAALVRPDSIGYLLNETNTDNQNLLKNDRELPINHGDLEKIYRAWSGTNSNTYILKKVYSLYRDSHSPKSKTYIFKKPGSEEILEVSNTHHLDGALSFSINYFTASEIEYDNFLSSLKASHYQYNKRTSCYETFIGTYEQVCIYTHGLTLKNNNTYYRVEYIRYHGKELSTSE